MLIVYNNLETVININIYTSKLSINLYKMATKEAINKREDFKKYLCTSGLSEALTKVLVNLYELEIKSINPLDYIRTHMTQIINEKEELKILKSKHYELTKQIQIIQEENMNLENSIKELENYK